MYITMFSRSVRARCKSTNVLYKSELAPRICHKESSKIQTTNATKGKRNPRLPSNLLCPVRKFPIQSSLCFGVDVVPKAAQATEGFNSGSSYCESNIQKWFFMNDHYLCKWPLTCYHRCFFQFFTCTIWLLAMAWGCRPSRCTSRTCLGPVGVVVAPYFWPSFMDSKWFQVRLQLLWFCFLGFMDFLPGKLPF